MDQQQQVTGNGISVIRRLEEQLFSLIDEYEKSGFTVKDFCGVSETNEGTFYFWIRKYRSKPDDEVKGFAQVDLIPTIVQSRSQHFSEVGSIKLYWEVPAEYLHALLS